jgi:fluoroquinolone transport system ATP-binding protein
LITVENLSFHYPKNTEYTLREITFNINKGEIFGFLGPSGSGKSTTQKILFKLLSGYKGNITFQGKPLQNWSREFYEKIGVSFELPNHYLKLTAIENLQFFSSFYKNRSTDINSLLDKTGLLGDANKLVSEYSKGMKVRLNFVHSLLHNPDFVFLDEPTSGLDPITARKIKDIILELKLKGKTIFLTTHNMFDADQLCDRVALLHHGKIIELDTPANLKLKYGERKVKVTLKDKSGFEQFELETLGKNEKFLPILYGGRIETIHSEEATLEEAFIKLTGDRLI